MLLQPLVNTKLNNVWKIQISSSVNIFYVSLADISLPAFDSERSSDLRMAEL
jgi:hypothetical protein